MQWHCNAGQVIVNMDRWTDAITVIAFKPDVTTGHWVAFINAPLVLTQYLYLWSRHEEGPYVRITIIGVCITRAQPLTC